jgi:hypothetical protein
MFKRSAAQPTHGWLIGNRIIRKLAWAFIILVLLSSFWAGMVTYAIRRDCNQLYTRNLRSLWLLGPHRSRQQQVRLSAADRIIAMDLLIITGFFFAVLWAAIQVVKSVKDWWRRL